MTSDDGALFGAWGYFIDFEKKLEIWRLSWKDVLLEEASFQQLKAEGDGYMVRMQKRADEVERDMDFLDEDGEDLEDKSTPANAEEETEDETHRRKKRRVLEEQRMKARVMSNERRLGRSFSFCGRQ